MPRGNSFPCSLYLVFVASANIHIKRNCSFCIATSHNFNYLYQFLIFVSIPILLFYSNLTLIIHYTIENVLFHAIFSAFSDIVLLFSSLQPVYQEGTLKLMSERKISMKIALLLKTSCFLYYLYFMHYH